MCDFVQSCHTAFGNEVYIVAFSSVVNALLILPFTSLILHFVLPDFDACLCRYDVILLCFPVISLVANDVENVFEYCFSCPPYEVSGQIFCYFKNWLV